MLAKINGLNWLLLLSLKILMKQRLVVSEDDVPEPVGLFPLNSLHTTKDISNNYLTAGTPVGVSLAQGPYGKQGGSYHFSGSSSSYIEIPQQTKLDTRYSLSLLVWIYNQGSEGPVIHYDLQSVSSYAVHFYIAGSPSSLFFRVTGRNTFTFVSPLSYVMGTVNKWRYIGFTYDYNSGKQQLFVDGVKVDEGNVGSIQLSTNYKIKIGGTKYGDSRVFQGRVSCLQIYNKALTQAQVLAAKNRCVENNGTNFRKIKKEFSRDHHVNITWFEMGNLRTKVKRSIGYRIQGTTDPWCRDYTSCFRYTFIDDPTRALESSVSGQPFDRQAFIRRRWYRLKSRAGTRIVTSCPAPGSCGAQSPGWLNGQYPSLESGIKKMEICYRSGSDCCGNKATVYLRQCYGYPVFMLDDVPDISLGNRVCTEPAPKSVFPNKMFQPTNGMCLTGHVIYTASDVTETLVCMGYCLNAGEKCKSVNFIQLDNGTCQINNATTIEFPLHVTSNSSCTYYQSSTGLISYVLP